MLALNGKKAALPLSSVKGEARVLGACKPIKFATEMHFNDKDKTFVYLGITATMHT